MTTTNLKQLKDRITLLLSNIEQGINVKNSVQEISHIGRTSGFGQDSELRLKAYSFLLGIEQAEFDNPFIPHIPTVEEEDNSEMIARNCNGSFRVFDACLNEDPDHLTQLRKDLEEIMVKLFSENKQYHYFRGYENFCSVMVWHFDALQVPIDQSVALQVHHIFEIVKKQDSQVAQIFSVTHFLAFCVSWVLTWFAFNIRKSKDLLQIYDFLVCSPPESMVILGAAFILGTKDIMKEHIQECQEGGEIGVLFGIYQNIWQVDYDINNIIKLAIKLENLSQFTNEMRQQYGEESIMHEEYLNSILPYRQYLTKVKKTKMKICLNYLPVLFLLFCVIFAFIYQ